MKEQDLVKPCLEYLHLQGCLAWRQNTGAESATYKGKRRWIRFGVPGMSDIIGACPDGRFLAVELKQPGKEPTEKQETFLRSVHAIGGVAIVATSLDELMEEWQKKYRERA